MLAHPTEGIAPDETVAGQAAVEEIAYATQHLLDALVTNAPPKNREVEAEKRRARYAART